MHPSFPVLVAGQIHTNAHQTAHDPTNTTVFVGGLDRATSESELRSHFEKFKPVYVKIPPKLGCGFVSFGNRESAEMAVEQMAGYMIGNLSRLIGR